MIPACDRFRGIAGFMALLLGAGCAHAGATSADAAADADARIVAVTDADVIQRGRYLAYGPAHCVACHTPDGPLTRFAPGETPPLVGGYTIDFTGGSVVTPNLTPDPETGIGRRTDRELVRLIRQGIRHDGSEALPIMTFQNLSDEDLRAVISFLRSQPSVPHAVPDRHLNLIGRLGMWLFVSAQGPDSTPPARSPGRDDAVSRGAYLVNSVAVCAACHTERSGLTGSLKGKLLAGGWTMALDGDPDREVVTPNLTPDPRTGIMAAWTEAEFVARFRAGPVIHGSHMPWTAFMTMCDEDLRAIYRYLRTLQPVEHDTGPVLRQKSEAPS